MKRELLKQVRIIDPVSDSDRVGDVLLIADRISLIQDIITDIPEETTVIAAEGWVLAPGLVDLYSQSGEPGNEDRETLQSLAQSAIAGGFTQVGLLPTTLPPLDNANALAGLQQRLDPASPVQIRFWGALTQGLKGETMTELAELAKIGILGFAEGRPIARLGLLRRILEYLKPMSLPLVVFPLDLALQGKGVMREGLASMIYGLEGDPSYSESVAVASILELVASLQTSVHLMRISTRRSLELIAEAKDRGLAITTSTSWLHLLFDTQDIRSYDPNLRLNPPLGNPDDRLALIEAVKSGIIDAIAVDHTPYTYEEKMQSFAQSPPGAIGLQLALPILWQRFVASGDWSALQLWRALSLNPRRCLNQSPLALSSDNNRDFIVFDPNQPWQVNGSSLYSLSRNTVWWGKTVKGKVLRVG